MDPTPARLAELVLYLPKRPASIKIQTCPWSGALKVGRWELSNSRERMQPTSIEKIDHIDGIQEWCNKQRDSFTLLPWASRAGAEIVYRAD